MGSRFYLFNPITRQETKNRPVLNFKNWAQTGREIWCVEVNDEHALAFYEMLKQRGEPFFVMGR